MKRTIKKLMLILLAALVSTGALSGCVKHTHIVVDSRRVGDYFCSFYEDGTVDITGYYGSDEELTVPEMIEGHVVIGFGIKAFDGNGTLKTVIIPQSVTSLPAKLFNSCSALESIYVPPFVQSIGKNVVYECPAFTTVLYGGSEAQWEKVFIGSVPWTDNYVLINSEMVYNFEP